MGCLGQGDIKRKMATIAHTVVGEKLELLAEATVELLELILKSVRDTTKHSRNTIYDDGQIGFSSGAKVLIRSIRYNEHLYGDFLNQYKFVKEKLEECNEPKAEKIMSKFDNKIKKVKEKYYTTYGIDANDLETAPRLRREQQASRIIQQREVEENPIVSEE